MKNANPFVPIPPNGLSARISQELDELCAILAIIDLRLENIDHTYIIIPPPVPFEQLLNDFMNPPNVFEIDDLESDNELVDTPLVSSFLDSDEESSDGEVLDELNEYRNAGNFYRNRRINSDGCELAFSCIIGSYEADECELENPSEQVCLFGGDIYNDPSLLRFYQNDDTSPWGNIKRKKKGEDGPEWTVRTKFEDELANFMLEKKFRTKGI
ncbi:hypothetical protein Tco_0199685 [Tanacetum coccineum]